MKKIKIGELEFKIKIEKTKSKTTYAKIISDTIIIRTSNIINKESMIHILKEKLEKLGLKDINKDILNNFILFGEPYKLYIKPIKKKLVIIKNRKIIVLNDMHKEEFKKYLEKKLKETAIEIINKYKIADFIPEIKIKNIKNKWAYVNLKEKTIYLNMLCIFLPHGSLEYIIVHELLHFNIPNHRKPFKEILYSLFPNWKIVEKELKKYYIIIQNNKNIKKYILKEC
jgi:predicted metal-dependent hydrolase